MNQTNPDQSKRLRVALIAVALLVAILAVSGWLDRQAADGYEANFDRALVSFGLARGLNGVISVVQGTELSVQPAGVGINFAPGEIVDPVNDLIERFSWVMLVSATSLGVQQVMLEISQWWGITLILILALVAVLWVWLRDDRSVFRRRFAMRFLMLCLLVRFAFPLMVLAEQAVFDVFMAEQYQQATEQITQTQTELEAIASDDEQASEVTDDGFFAGMKRWWDETAERVDVKQQLADFQQKLAEVTEDLLRLIAIFVLKTIIFPIAFLWIFGKSLKGSTRLGRQWNSAQN